MGLPLLAIGLVLIVEGLAIALAPSRMEEVLARLAQLPRDRRRAAGLLALALGIVLVWFARLAGW